MRKKRAALVSLSWFATIAAVMIVAAALALLVEPGTVGVLAQQEADPRQQRGQRSRSKEEDRRTGSSDSTTKNRGSSGDPARSPIEGATPANQGSSREAADRARQQQQQHQKEQQRERKRRRRDAREVRRILRAAARGDWYGVLGLWNWDVRVPGRIIGFQGREWLRLPEFCLFRPSTQDVRKAYRRRSVGVHPDRNRDAQAPEAFRALEEAAALLSDESQRAFYDAQIRSERIRRRDAAMGATIRTVASAAGLVSRTASVARNTLGPFAVPALVLGSLIV